jgi:hypothetical protein
MLVFDMLDECIVMIEGFLASVAADIFVIVRWGRLGR